MMADEKHMVFTDAREDVDLVSRYAAFLELQNQAGGMTDQEYLDRLAEIDGSGAFQAAAFGYTDEEMGRLSDAERQVILQAQEDLEKENANRPPKRVLQFDGGTVPETGLETGDNVAAAYAGTSDENPEGESEPEAVLEDESGSEAALEEASDGDSIEVTVTDGVTGGEDDPSLDIRYGGEEAVAMSEEEEAESGIVLGAGGIPAKSDAEDEAEKDLEEESVPAASQVGEPEQEIPVTGPAMLEDEDEAEAQKDVQLGWAPAGKVPNFEDGQQTVQQPVPEGHMQVSEEIQINDWLDEVGAGMGLVRGVQTAEYVPPEPQAQPAQAAPVRSEKMQQLDRMVERIYGPAEGGTQKESDGPSR